MIGAKNFTEQVILGELLAQEIEARSSLKVDRRFYLAGSYDLPTGIGFRDTSDAYVEYIGHRTYGDPEAAGGPGSAAGALIRFAGSVRDTIWSHRCAPPLGFENTFAMVIRGEDARQMRLTTLSCQAVPYAAKWRLGVGYEFEQRPDGLPGLSAAYGLRFCGAAANDGSGAAVPRA